MVVWKQCQVSSTSAAHFLLSSMGSATGILLHHPLPEHKQTDSYVCRENKNFFCGKPSKLSEHTERRVFKPLIYRKESWSG